MGKQTHIAPLNALKGELVLGTGIAHASPILVAAALIPGSTVFITDIRMKETDDLGMVRVIEHMGAQIQLLDRASDADAISLEIRTSQLHPIDFNEYWGLYVSTYSLLPILAHFLKQETRLIWPEDPDLPAGADVHRACRQIGIATRFEAGELVIAGTGSRLQGGVVSDELDETKPYMALMLIMAGLLSRNGVTATELEKADEWWPNLVGTLQALQENQHR